MQIIRVIEPSISSISVYALSQRSFPNCLMPLFTLFLVPLASPIHASLVRARRWSYFLDGFLIWSHIGESRIASEPFLQRLLRQQQIFLECVEAAVQRSVRSSRWH